MKTWYVVLPALPVILGIVAWSARSSRPRRSATRIESPAVVTLERTVDEVRPRDKGGRKKTREELETGYEERIRKLIASIDWTRPESRERFPIEVEALIKERNANPSESR